MTTSDWERGLRKMCDYGAGRVKAGEYDVVRFDCMGNEVAIIRAYMEATHPTVRFFCTYPAGLGAGQ